MHPTAHARRPSIHPSILASRRVRVRVVRVVRVARVARVVRVRASRDAPCRARSSRAR
jgi:hypothetical protein